ncbi:hypothetical protein FOA52_000791 [Chlamydomonas sp. UWO 241]|nr:hypothetical protein FOA52_000791 [Chlamydomonas sp. UWO 241]
MVLPTSLLRMAGAGTFASAKPIREYRWHDITNPAYNSFFRGTLPKAQGVILTAGTAYGIYLSIFAPAER